MNRSLLVKHLDERELGTGLHQSVEHAPRAVSRDASGMAHAIRSQRPADHLASGELEPGFVCWDGDRCRVLRMCLGHWSVLPNWVGCRTGPTATRVVCIADAV